MKCMCFYSLFIVHLLQKHIDLLQILRINFKGKNVPIPLDKNLAISFNQNAYSRRVGNIYILGIFKHYA